MYLFLAARGLRCGAQTFSSCGEWGLLSSCSTQASHCGAMAAPVAEHGLQALRLSSCGAQA